MEKIKFGFTSQSYEAPRAESVDVAQESILCASPNEPEVTAGDYETSDINGW